MAAASQSCRMTEATVLACLHSALMLSQREGAKSGISVSGLPASSSSRMAGRSARQMASVTRCAWPPCVHACASV